METGTLNELNLKPGDLVECVNACGSCFVCGAVYECVKGRDGWGNEAVGPLNPIGRCIPSDKSTMVFRIVSRASETPKLWRDMTPEEKGAMLLAHHEGNVIEVWDNGWRKRSFNVWAEGVAYRVLPEPKRETVTMEWAYEKGGKDGYAHPKNSSATHRITFDLIDGKPDPSSIKMEAI